MSEYEESTNDNSDKKVFIFGGSFNPPHWGHVLAAINISLTEPNLEEIAVVPCFQHPDHKSLAPFSDRFEMCCRAFGQINKVHVSGIEEKLPTPSYTIETVKALQKEYQELFDQSFTFRLVLGEDIKDSVETWDSWSELKELAVPYWVPRISVSSTQVRKLVAENDLKTVERLVPAEVYHAIRSWKLYE